MKKILAIIMIVFLITGLVGCYANEGDIFDSGDRFAVVEHNICNDFSSELDSFILVDEETGVLYVLLETSMYKMAMTVLLNADGTPMTMEEYKNEDH